MEMPVTETPAPPDPAERTSQVVDGFPFTRQLTDWFDARPWVDGASASTLAEFTVLVGLIATASLLFVGLRPVIRWLGKHALARGGFTWHHEFREQRVYFWFTHFIPGILVRSLSSALFPASPRFAGVLETAAELYLVFSGYFLMLSLIRAIQTIVAETGYGRTHNVVLVAQMARVIATLVLMILCLVVLLHKPPLLVLSGLGVFASVLMLIFKDVILGFGAGIQLSLNKMLAVGDWLEMPSHDADGTVEEIGVSAVKVRNWDETITTVPTYALISESFRNWRGMSESGGRRIKRRLMIDTNSIRLCDEEMLDQFRKIALLRNYLEEKEKDLAGFNQRLGPEARSIPANERRLTNVGTFRAYMVAYLRQHPEINQGMMLMIRHLEPTGRGLPIEVYCFSANQEWVAYEGIQSDIFDHFLAIAPEFGLRIFQEPSGHDLQALTEARG